MVRRITFTFKIIVNRSYEYIDTEKKGIAQSK